MENPTPAAFAGFFSNRAIWEEPINSIQFAALESRTCNDLSSVDVALSFLPLSDKHRRRLSVRHSCNGLLLVGGRGDFLLVCNPATKTWANVGLPPTDDFEALASVFDPRLSPHFKVVSFPRTNGSTHSEWDGRRIEVFSSETGKWTHSPMCWLGSGDPLRGGYELDRENIVFLNGLLYVLETSGNTMVVDLDKNAFWRLECRESRADFGLRPRDVEQCLGCSQGLLHLAALTQNILVVWVLEDPKSNVYVLKHRSIVDGALGDYTPFGLNKNRLYGFHADMYVVFLGVPMKAQDKLLSYDLRSSTSEEIHGAQVFNCPCAYCPRYSLDLCLSNSASKHCLFV